MHKRRIRNRSEPRLGFRVWYGNRGSGALLSYGYRPQTRNLNFGERAKEHGVSNVPHNDKVYLCCNISKFQKFKNLEKKF